MAAKKTTKKESFTREERAAMRQRAAEAKGKNEGEDVVLAAIQQLAPDERALALRVHALVTANAPGVAPRTWYGMPAYAKDGDVVCFFQGASKFKARYATVGFSDAASLDDGNLWPVAFALRELGAAEEARLAQLVRRAFAGSG